MTAYTHILDLAKEVEPPADGGAVAMNINSSDAKIVLLCPAWKN